MDSVHYQIPKYDLVDKIKQMGYVAVLIMTLTTLLIQPTLFHESMLFMKPDELKVVQFIFLFPALFLQFNVPFAAAFISLFISLCCSSELYKFVFYIPTLVCWFYVPHTLQSQIAVAFPQQILTTSCFYFLFNHLQQNVFETNIESVKIPVLNFFFVAPKLVLFVFQFLVNHYILVADLAFIAIQLSFGIEDEEFL